MLPIWQAVPHGPTTVAAKFTMLMTTKKVTSGLPRSYAPSYSSATAQGPSPYDIAITINPWPAQCSISQLYRIKMVM